MSTAAFLKPTTWTTLLVSLSLIDMPLPGWAWGEQGHQVIAHLAQAQLTSKAHREVDRLLELEPGQT